MPHTGEYHPYPTGSETTPDASSDENAFETPEAEADETSNSTAQDHAVSETPELTQQPITPESDHHIDKVVYKGGNNYELYLPGIRYSLTYDHVNGTLFIFGNLIQRGGHVQGYPWLTHEALVQAAEEARLNTVETNQDNSSEHRAS